MMKAAGMDGAVIEALREGSALPDPKLQALHDYTKELLDKRGHIGDEQLHRFLDAGYDKKQALGSFEWPGGKVDFQLYQCYCPYQTRRGNGGLFLGSSDQRK